MHADLERWVGIPDSLRVSSWIRPRAELSSAVAGSAASRARRRRFRSVELAACEQQQIGGHDRRPSICIERTQGSPGTASPADTPLEERDRRFDTCAKIPERPERRLVACHLLDGDALRLGEDNIANVEPLDFLEVGARREGTVKAYLLRRTPVPLHVSLDHADGERGVSRVALLDVAIGDQSGGACGETELVTVERVPSVFDDDVGMGFE